MDKRRQVQRGLLAMLLMAGTLIAGGRPATPGAAAADPCPVTIHRLPDTFGTDLTGVVAAAPGDVWAVGGAGNDGAHYSAYHVGWPLILR